MDFPSVAVVHDYLNQCGGAERVALELARMWPGAPIYTSLYRPESTFPAFADQDVRVSVLDRVPVDTGFRVLAPLYPMAFRSLGILDHEVVISSSSGWAHGVRTSPNTLHVVYCHTPARWLYRSDDYLGRSLGQSLMAPLCDALRRWDKDAARQPDLYIANGEHVRRRIAGVYGRDSVVIHPPVDVTRFTPRPRGTRLLVVSRLLPYKRVDLVVRAANCAGLGLDVIGTGPHLECLRALAGPTVEFHGSVDEGSMKEMLEGCRALCVAGTEDFGIAPVEANAAGKPVVAYARGGLLETVQDGVNGIHFAEPNEQALISAIARADALDRSPAELARAARRFSVETFRGRLRTVIAEGLERKAPRARRLVGALPDLLAPLA